MKPSPSASVSTATAVKPGCFSNWRKAKRRSFMVEGKNIEHRTSNVERRSSGSPFGRTFDVQRAMLDVRCSFYSYRSASIGSTLVALRAGRKQASSATARTTRTTSAKTNGSVGLTPKS